MANQTYATGTVSVPDGGTIVTGIGTIWSGANVKIGDTIYLNNLLPGIEIADITDLTHLVLPVPRVGALTNVPYTIVQNFPARVVGVAAAQDVSRLVAALNKEGFIWFVGPTETAPDPSLGNEGQYGEQPSTGKKWVKTGGIWVYLGIYGSFKFDPVVWTAATTYAQGDAVPFQGKTWVSLQSGNLSNRPDINPTFWTKLLGGGDNVYIAMDDSDRPATGETVLKFISPKAMTIYSGMVDSYANANVGATSTAVYSIKKNGTQFATITFASGGQAGTQSGVFACAADIAFAAGDILTIVAPNPRDATLSTIGITLTGYR